MLAMVDAARKKDYQTTTVRMPREVYEEAKSVVEMHHVPSINEFIVGAVRDKLREITEADIDAAFAEMANDPDYQTDAIAMARQFEQSDAEVFRLGQHSEHERTAEAETSNARSR